MYRRTACLCRAQSSGVLHYHNAVWVRTSCSLEQGKASGPVLQQAQRVPRG